MEKENDSRLTKRKRKQFALIFFGCIFVFLFLSYFSTFDEKQNEFNALQEKNVNFNGYEGLQIKYDRSNPALRAAHGDLHLIGLSFGRRNRNNDRSKYDNVVGEFCKLDWSYHKQNPSSYPMFKDLIAKSRSCRSSIEINLSEVVKAAKSLDAKFLKFSNTMKVSVPYSIPPKGFVFHESRCGSTLVANSLAAVNPDENRVYSESAPLITAMKMVSNDIENPKSDESLEDAKQFVKDIVYIMGRTNDIEEKNLFFKIQSIGTTHIRSLRAAFPDIPWVFIYRDPVQVMMSHMPKATENAVCLRSRGRPPPGLNKYVQSISNRAFNSLTTYESCAAHLSFLCHSILEEKTSTNTGRVINYNTLPGSLLDDIFPNYFDIPVGKMERNRVEEVCTKYSKGRGYKAGIWKDDTKKKDDGASSELRRASESFLQPIYKRLELYGQEDRNENK